MADKPVREATKTGKDSAPAMRQRQLAMVFRAEKPRKVPAVAQQ
jgi:hypothetical protein